jgi:hypothetical protein
MSETINPPEYYFTNIDFNPAFYANNLPPEDQAFLDARYVKFPLAQNVPITFTATVRGLTALLTENSNIIATTQWVQNFFNYVKTIANTWTGTQTFTLGMLTDTINPTTPSGTLIIGNTSVNTNVEVATQSGRTAILRLGDGTGASTSGEIHIGNGSSSTNAVNILYSSTDAGSSGTINLGSVNGTVNLRSPLTPTSLTYPLTAGKIGFILTGTFADVANPTISTDYELASLLIPAGVWILQGACGLTNTIAGNNALIAINTTATTTDARARQMYSYSSVSASPNIASFTTQLLISINTDTTYYFMAVTTQAISPAFSWNRIIFEATRIA